MQDTVDSSFKPKKFNWLVFLFLCALVFITTFFSVPYQVVLLGKTSNSSSMSNPMVLIAIGQLVFAILLWPLIALGMLTAGRIGMGMPIIESFFTNEPVGAKPKKLLLPGLLAGMSVGGVIVLLLMIIAASTGKTIFHNQYPAPWRGLLAAISAGITEEILLRLFLLSTIAWVALKIGHSLEGHPTKAVFWIANLLSAIIFGLLHLPQVSILAPSASRNTNFLILGLNTTLGMVFGWLYGTYGLESAMLGHFSSDFVLKVILPLLSFLF